MIITYYGKQFFKVQQGDITIAINPLSKENSLKKKPARFASDIVMVSLHHPDFNGFSQTSFNNKEAFKIYGPGIYELKGITIYGYGHLVHIDGKDYINTVYFFDLDGVNFAFIGGMDSENLSQEAKEHIESVDVIFVPIGGKGTLDPVQAAKIVKDFSPKIIIPMDYGEDREKDSLKLFQKEMGSESGELRDKLVFKRSELDSLNGEVIPLKEI